MTRSKLLAGAMMLDLTTGAAQAGDCPFPYEAVPRKVIVITSEDDLANQCRNIYEALSKDNPCQLDNASRQGIAREFYRASKGFREALDLNQCRGTGPKTSQLMSCLVSSADEYAFSDCLGLQQMVRGN
jgi:hypothetical protein